MKNPEELLHAITDRIKAELDTRTVYGETRQIGDKLIIPVARVSFGFGAGSVPVPPKMSPDAGPPESGPGGGGGGVNISPVGFLINENGELRFMPVTDNRRMLLALGVGIGIGLLIGLGRRLRRKK